MDSELSVLCKAHMAKYPSAKPLDILKMVHQGEFGPGHLVKDWAANREYLEEEYARLVNRDGDYTEDIGFGFYRLHLNAIGADKLSIDTFQRLFELSASKSYGTPQGFFDKVAVLKGLCCKGDLPFEKGEFDNFPMDCKPFRHSEAFREAYNPAYRVIKMEFARFLPLLMQIDSAMAQDGQVIVAIDGDAAAGKTTLATMLRQIYGCNVLPMDHFFLRPEQRTESRLAEPGGNVDYERFIKEALNPLLAQKSFIYRPFDCRIWDFGDEIAFKPGKLTIIEGSYAHHPKFVDNHNIKVFIKIEEDEQMRRIIQRNGAEMSEKFRDIWIPMEKEYQAAFGIKEKGDLVF